MESIIRNVAEIGTADWQALEHVLDQQLRENQQAIIHIVNMDVQPAKSSGAPHAGKLPEWCNVYEGLRADQVADLEKVVLTKADLLRAAD
jgi:hypothetical protein